MSREEAIYTSVGEMKDLMAWKNIENGLAKQIYRHKMNYQEAISLI